MNAETDTPISSIQPGGGVCMALELKWGRLRRRLLKRFFPGHVRQMAATRQGSCDNCPHEVLDPRDLKFISNTCGYYWNPEDDPYAWRDRLPVARVGLAELLLSSSILVAIAVASWVMGWWPVSLVALVLWLGIAWFFRDPPRHAVEDSNTLVSPADGTIAAIDSGHHDFVGGPSITIGIFLSVFNVHINRAPVEVRVVRQIYRPGKFLNALLPRSAQENEQSELRLEQVAAPHRCLVVRQIAGALARRIVCWTAPGRQLRQGQQFGMIKLGSRTELVLPQETGLEIAVKIGDRVKAGTTVLARYNVASPTAVESTEQARQPTESVRR